MARSLNGAAVSWANGRIAAGAVNRTAPWDFTAADGDRLLGPGGDDWAAYGRVHLGINSGTDPHTKQHYSYPAGKGGTLYVSALRAIRSRASTQGDTAIFDAAGALLNRVNGSKSEGVDMPMSFASALIEDFSLATGEGGTPAGTFSGYLARYGNTDDKGDTFAAGAFKKSLAEYKAKGKLPPMWLNHGGLPFFGAVSVDSLVPIGIWETMQEDQNGLRVKGRIDPMDTDRGKQVYAAMRNKTMDGLSVGYRAIAYDENRDAGTRLIHEAKLFEGSIVFSPANDLATIDSVASGMQSLLARAMSVAGDDFDPRNIRHLDKALHALGLSRGEARAILAGGFKAAFPGQRDAGTETALTNLRDALAAARRSLR